MNDRRNSVRPACWLVTLCILSLVAGCASPSYSNHKPSEFVKTTAPKLYEIESVVSSVRKAESFGQIDSTQGILPGTYAAVLENSDGTLFLGGARSYFVKYANNKSYYLRSGGFWIPRADGVAPKLFYIVDSTEIHTAASIEEAIKGNADVQKPEYQGLIVEAAIQAEQGNIVLVPTDTSFSGRLSAQLKPMPPPETEMAR